MFSPILPDLTQFALKFHSYGDMIHVIEVFLRFTNVRLPKLRQIMAYFFYAFLHLVKLIDFLV